MNAQHFGRIDHCPQNLQARARVILQDGGRRNDDAKEPCPVIRLIPTLGRDV